MAFQHRRFYVLTGPSSGGTPTAGGEVDGASGAGDVVTVVLVSQREA